MKSVYRIFEKVSGKWKLDHAYYDAEYQFESIKDAIDTLKDDGADFDTQAVGEYKLNKLYELNQQIIPKEIPLPK